MAKRNQTLWASYLVGGFVGIFGVPFCFAFAQTSTAVTQITALQVVTAFSYNGQQYNVGDLISGNNILAIDTAYPQNVKLVMINGTTAPTPVNPSSGGIITNLGAANGAAQLDANSKLLPAELPASVLTTALYNVPGGLPTLDSADTLSAQTVTYNGAAVSLATIAAKAETASGLTAAQSATLASALQPGTVVGLQPHQLSAGVVAASITAPASGSAPSGATQLSSARTQVTTCSASAPLQLPVGPSVGSFDIKVINRASTVCPVYPPNGGTIEANGVNVPVTIGSGQDVTFTSVLPTTAWDE